MDKILFDQLKTIQELERRAYQAGYKSKEDEIRLKKEKELDEMYQDSLKAEEIMENTNSLEEKAEQLENEKFDYHPRPEDENFYQRWKKSNRLIN